MEEIENYYCKIPDTLKSYCSYFDNFVVEDVPSFIFEEENYKCLREYAVFRMGFSVVTKRNCRILAQIINGKKVLEVMCGLGSYASTLRSCGVDVIATDDMSWINYDTSKYQGWKTHAWIHDIISMDAIEAVKKYGKEVGFITMSWPPQNSDLAYKVLQTMRKVNPECILIYIGEKKGGCTADDRFFDDYIDISSNFAELQDLKKSYHNWKNNQYFDTQLLLK